MKSVIINRSGQSNPRTYIQEWVLLVVKSLKKRKHKIAARELIIVMVDTREMKRLNTAYRGKPYATDVLSFVSQEPQSLGELVLCPAVLKRQSKEHGLSYREEVGYMILHGILHLLGYDHEKSQKEAKKMFQIQDDVFEELCKSV